MHFSGIGVMGSGSFLPEQTLTTRDLCRELGTDATWVEENLGVLQRHVAGPDENTATMCHSAAQNALEQASLTPDEVDLLVLATATPNRAAPATAALVHERLGLTDCPALDLNAVCAGSVYALTTAAGMLAGGAGRTALVVAGDTFSRITDYTDRDAVYFGDGAASVVLRTVEDQSHSLHARLGAGGRNRLGFTVPAGGSETPASPETVEAGLHYFRMEGRDVYSNATDIFPGFAKDFLSEAGVSPDSVDHFVFHQASKRLLSKVAEGVGVPGERVASNVARVGNTASASPLLLLDSLVTDGSVKNGDLVLMGAFGAGWVWGASLFRWAGEQT
ncbi:ketoacyl-ACP synthase III [Nocardiopsis tropica]|uniref:Ketoacyl-ACP synthase III n=1 Tax=Nocardiopsis tropica TaxID=109330 RepID=A0ABU7KL63_9ACTN|nr:ketoacyl-ACP synthase III [Nocardiopsis umidischolae]MEE2049754.1 ketoacyl-ACP synthase III [Nocardiopsis umidischolae]